MLLNPTEPPQIPLVSVPSPQPCYLTLWPKYCQGDRCPERESGRSFQQRSVWSCPYLSISLRPGEPGFQRFPEGWACLWTDFPVQRAEAGGFNPAGSLETTTNWSGAKKEVQVEWASSRFEGWPGGGKHTESSSDSLKCLYRKGHQGICTL